MLSVCIIWVNYLTTPTSTRKKLLNPRFNLIGQFAIDYFVLVYLTPYIIGAAIIAMSAVTAALYIFFKLRERWMDAWYKRLGCAMLMALAVCGNNYLYPYKKDTILTSRDRHALHSSYRYRLL